MWVSVSFRKKDRMLDGGDKKKLWVHSCLQPLLQESKVALLYCYSNVILPCPTKGYVGAWWLTREVSTRSLTYIRETTAFCYRDLVRKGFASKYIPLPSERFTSCESLFFGGGKKLYET